MIKYLPALALPTLGLALASSMPRTQQGSLRADAQRALSSTTGRSLQEVDFDVDETDSDWLPLSMSEPLSCSQDPFLWLIKKDDVVEGFGVGTIHVKRETVATEQAWQSLKNAAADACTIYGESDFSDPAVVAMAMSKCANPNPVHLSDIPDEELRDRYTAVVMQVASEYHLQMDAEALAKQLLQMLTVDVLQQFAIALNTPELKDDFFKPMFVAGQYTFLDVDLLSLGRPSESLETADETCAAAKAMSPDKQYFLDNFHDKYQQILWDNLNATSSNLLQAYRCGSVPDILDYVFDGADSVDDDATAALLNGTYRSQYV